MSLLPIGMFRDDRAKESRATSLERLALTSLLPIGKFLADRAKESRTTCADVPPSYQQVPCRSCEEVSSEAR
ncbi:hypothetical protein L3X38_032748 [Prunus dulcis]|uniref:Uncharacterized protein n=1 Tax=Prunus dulcis TaxID=3755 RepID=A0AAD4YW68_PRUDU|nr:hypothetical protein L3X38_032748 [Prunus dulcis]